MSFKRNVVLGLGAAAVAATMVVAGGHGGNPAVKARKAHMQLYAHNLGILGAMAKGEAEYNADAAQAAADNLASLASFNQMSYWPEGTSNAELGDETRALPVGWTNMEDAMAKGNSMVEAVMAMQAAAGSLEGVQGAIGAVGGACGDCHKVYRAPNN